MDRSKIGRETPYGGMGLDLVGKAMEVVSGKSIFRLMHENLLQPLGFKDPSIRDLGYGVACRVVDLACIGQLLLNGGAYGDVEIVSPATFPLVMPSPLKDSFPDVENDWEYGLGVAWMRDSRQPEGEKDGTAEKHLIFAKNTVGHGSSSGCTLRADPGSGLVVAQARSSPGEEYKQCEIDFMWAVAQSVNE